MNPKEPENVIGFDKETPDVSVVGLPGGAGDVLGAVEISRPLQVSAVNGTHAPPTFTNGHFKWSVSVVEYVLAKLCISSSLSAIITPSPTKWLLIKHVSVTVIVAPSTILIANPLS